MRGPAVRYFQSAAMMLTVATLVAALDGHPWQIDMHMYFFASLAMLAAFCDWRAILVATATVAVHHLALNFILPAAVFPNGGDFFRVVMHAVIVLIEAGVLIWVSHHMAHALVESENAVTNRPARRAAGRGPRRADPRARGFGARGTPGQCWPRSPATSSRPSAPSSNASPRISDRATALAASMATAARENAQRVGAAATASSAASGDAQSIAAAAEELSASVSEIQRQVQRSTEITARAVNEAGTSSAKVRPAHRGRAENRRHRPPDQRDRLADQSPRVERDHRGGARRRCRQGLRGGGERSEIARQPDRQGDRGNLRPDHRDPGRHPRIRAGDSFGLGDDRRGERGGLPISTPRSISRTPRPAKSPRVPRTSPAAPRRLRMSSKACASSRRKPATPPAKSPKPAMACCHCRSA